MYPTRIEIEEIFLKTFNINTNLRLSGMRKNKDANIFVDGQLVLDGVNANKISLSQDSTQIELTEEELKEVERILEEAQ